MKKLSNYYSYPPKDQRIELEPASIELRADGTSSLAKVLLAMRTSPEFPVCKPSIDRHNATIARAKACYSVSPPMHFQYFKRLWSHVLTSIVSKFTKTTRIASVLIHTRFLSYEICSTTSHPARLISWCLEAWSRSRLDQLWTGV
jgi:hypothetical protein